MVILSSSLILRRSTIFKAHHPIHKTNSHKIYYFCRYQERHKYSGGLFRIDEDLSYELASENHRRFHRIGKIRDSVWERHVDGGGTQTGDEKYAVVVHQRMGHDGERRFDALRCKQRTNSREDGHY